MEFGEGGKVNCSGGYDVGMAAYVGDSPNNSCQSKSSTESTDGGSMVSSSSLLPGIGLYEVSIASNFDGPVHLWETIEGDQVE